MIKLTQAQTAKADQLTTVLKEREKEPGYIAEALPDKYPVEKNSSAEEENTIDLVNIAPVPSSPLRSSYQFGKLPLQPKPSLTIQPKLAVNTPGDEYEQEADAMAEKVMGMTDVSDQQVTPSPAGISHRKCDVCGKEEEVKEEQKIEEETETGEGIVVQRKCAACEAGENNKVQRKEYDGSTPVASAAVQQVLQSKGEPLDDATRSFMERRFGFDFSKVQIHNNATAHQSAKDINALAYTHQQKIIFGAGQYKPETETGKRLLAHELTHVVQQRDGDKIKRKAEVPEFNIEDNVTTVTQTHEIVEETYDTEANPVPLDAAKFLVEDGTVPGKGQMQKTEFLDALNKAVCKTVDRGLEGSEFTADACPYIRASFSKYKNNTPLYIEQLIDRYSGVLGSARSAHELIQLMQARVMEAVKNWVKTGEMSGVPQDIQSEIYATMSNEVKERIKRKATQFAKPLFKGKQGGAGTTKTSKEILDGLGEGKQLEGDTRNKMESAFGTDFNAVKVHDGRAAAIFTSEMNARAFSIGNHVVLGSDEYKPGSITGDALMAHELSHVVQQRQSAGDINSLSEINEQAFEEDANRSTTGLIANLLSKTRRWAGTIMPRLRSGLAIQKCCFYDDMSQKQINEWQKILQNHLVVMNGEDPSIINSRFEFSFAGENADEIEDLRFGLEENKKLIYPSGRVVEWIKDDNTDVDPYGGATYSDLRPVLSEEGQYDVTIALVVMDENAGTKGTITVTKTFSVESVRTRSNKAFGKITDESFDSFRAGLIEQTALLEPDNTPVDPGDTHITSSSPNPAKSDAKDSAANLTYHVANDAPGKEYQWYIRPVQWDKMPDKVGSFPSVDVKGVKFYDLGTASSATWPAIYPNIYVVVCKRFENIGQGVKRELEDLVYLQTILTEDALKELAEFKKYAAQVDSLSKNITGEKVQVKALHVNKESGHVTPLHLFAGKNANGEGFVLVDMTAGLDPSEFKLVYHGKTTEELKNDFKADNKYPEGEINIEFPSNKIGLDAGGWYLQTTGTTIWTALSGGLGIASFLLAVGAIVAAPFTEGGSLVVGGLLLGSAVTGVAAGTFSIIDNLKNEQLSKTRMGIDIAGIVASMIGGAAAVRAVRAGGNAVLLANSTTRFLLLGNLGVAAVSTFLVSIDGVAQIDKVLSSKLNNDQKAAAITRIVANLIITGAMLYLAHKDMKAIGAKLNSVLGESLGKSLSDEERFMLVLLDEQTLGKLAGSKKEDLSRLVKAIREDPSFIQRATRHSDLLLKSLQNAKGDTLEHLERALMTTRMEALGMKTDEALKFTELLNKAGFRTTELNLLDDVLLVKMKDPAVLKELQLTAASSGRIKGLDKWIRFNGPKAPVEIADGLAELKEARRLADENPGLTVRLAKETDAPLRPGTKDERMPEFDLALESKSGVIERSVEVKNVAGKVTQATDLSDGVRHAASEKARPRKDAGMPIEGELDASIQIELAVGTKKRGTNILEITADGTVEIKGGDGRHVKTENIFDIFAEQISKINNNELLSGITIVNRSGIVLAVYKNKGGIWQRIKKI